MTQNFFSHKSLISLSVVAVKSVTTHW